MRNIVNGEDLVPSQSPESVQKSSPFTLYNKLCQIYLGAKDGFCVNSHCYVHIPVRKRGIFRGTPCKLHALNCRLEACSAASHPSYISLYIYYRCLLCACVLIYFICVILLLWGKSLECVESSYFVSFMWRVPLNYLFVMLVCVLFLHLVQI